MQALIRECTARAAPGPVLSHAQPPLRNLLNPITPPKEMGILKINEAALDFDLQQFFSCYLTHAKE
ncbi:hypothetical protein GLYMA_01G180900v4 [Glycine max]|uniref:Uncharacterized protein n=2 Tax=Glycine subgen. Soja TaxID=1462606 RepID=K7K4I6_SOYBN|nr:hypothetical protein JHK87_002157 [Glycine soja]KAG5069839.1 hypothetical protein JHK85_002216 [Glycine max]KAG5069842.1 hypothetical protein JHK85_002219 [Glycine max]KAG5089548.1 hypothetical protein JHK86_002160 [Glycine max]KAH1163702.1 hypothetical protein GYH30_001967 [Glycine max]